MKRVKLFSGRRGKGRLKLVLTALVALLIGAFVTILFSCPNPIGDVLAKQIADADVPNIAVTSPVDGGVYSGTVAVKGSIADADGDVKNLQVRVPAAEIDEAVELGEDGSFSYSFSSYGITETILITLTARDWNGNESTKTITLFNDGTGPYIEITEPVDFSAYSTVVRVSGTVTDAAGAASTGEVSACSYSIPGTSVVGDLALGSGGSFSLTFATRNPDGTQVIDGPATIRISAEDWNGNTAASSVTVVKAETGDFSSFTVTPGNKQATIEWEPVPHAESYTIFESNYGISEEGVSSGYVWEGLENGEMYAFQVKAEIPDELGEDSYSTTIEKMPLSARTFAPWIKETGYRSITIEWRGNPYVSTYTVERSLSPDGPWEVRRNLGNTDFTDTRTEHITEYYYRVYPAALPDIKSEHISGVPGRFAGGALSSLTTKSGWGISIVESYAYIANGSGGLAVIDISSPNDLKPPVYVGINGSAYGVVVDGSYAYVAAGNGGLAIVDVTDPRNPGTPVYVDIEGEVWDVAVDGTHAYATANDKGLAIVDIADPVNPGPVIYRDTIGFARGITLCGSYAYVADHGAGLAVINIEDPANPGEPVNRNTTGDAMGVTVDGSHAYLVFDSIFESKGGLAVIDVSDPENPGEPVERDIPGYTKGITVDGSHAYAAYAQVGGEAGGVAVFDISTPSNPGAPEYIDTYYKTYDVEIVGSYLYAVRGGEGLLVLDMAKPENTGISVCRDTSSYARRVAVSRAHAYLAVDTSGLAVIDVSDPESPGIPIYREPSQYGYAQDVETAGFYTYLVEYSGGGLSIIDCSNPENPDVTASMTTAGHENGLAVAGQYAFVAAGDKGLAIIDISVSDDPMPPVYRDTTGDSQDVDVVGTYAYVADGGSGLAVIDVSDPVNPGAPVYRATEGYAQGITAYGSYVYIANREKGLAISDVSNPENPGELVDYSTGGDSWDVAVSGSYAYVAVNNNSLAVLDVSDPVNPGAPLYIPTTNTAYGVTVSGLYAYVAVSSSGLEIIKLWEDSE